MTWNWFASLIPVFHFIFISFFFSFSFSPLFLLLSYRQSKIHDLELVRIFYSCLSFHLSQSHRHNNIIIDITTKPGGERAEDADGGAREVQVDPASKHPKLPNKQSFQTSKHPRLLL